MKKSYGKWFISFVLDHFLVILLAALIFAALESWNYGIVIAVSNVLKVLVALAVFYHESWKVGIADYTLKQRSGVESSQFRGLVAGCFAAIPSFLIALFAFLCAVNNWSVGSFDATNVEIYNLVYKFWFFPFAIVFDALESSPWIYFLPVPVLPVMSAIGYAFGSRKKMLRDYIYYKREQEEGKS